MRDHRFAWIVGIAALLLPAAAAALSFQIQPSRCTTAAESCPAPLAVMFRTNISNDAFLKWHCDWNFGDDDPVSGANAEWTNGVAFGELKKKNYAAGPIAAHVYEGARDATYTVQATCRDETGNTGTATAQIYVDDPATTWAGSKTVCVSTSGSFTGCPADAQQVTSGDAASVLNTYATADRRVLFRRGESWTHQGVVTKHDLGGPTLIGAFGTGAKPHISGSSGADGQGIIAFEGLSDWRWVDLDFQASSASMLFCTQGQCLGTVNPDDHILFLRIDSTGFARSLLGTYEGISPSDQRHANMFWVGPSQLSGANSNILFTDGWGGALIDTALHGGFHNFRFMCVRNFIVAHNTTYGGSDTTTLRGCQGMSGANSYRVIVSDNDFRDPLQIGYPNGTGLNMQVHYMVYERNFQDNVSEQTQSYNSVFRNNTCVRSGDTCIFVSNQWERNVMPDPFNVRLYNNSMFNPSGDQAGIRFDGSIGSGNSCTNNLIYTPSSGNALACSNNASGTAPVIQNNLNDASSSPFVASQPSKPSDFALGATSGQAAIDKGTSVPYDGIDALDDPRLLDGDSSGSAQIDIGAVESPGATGTPPPPPAATLSPPVLLD